MRQQGALTVLAALLLVMSSAHAWQDPVQGRAPSKAASSVASSESADEAERRLKLEAIRTRRLQAEAEADEAETRLRALASEHALRHWALEVQRRVEANWVRPRSELPSDYPCAAQIYLASSGEVDEIAFPQPCSKNGKVEKQIRKAIRAASPLIPPVDPSVFKGKLLLRFSPPAPQAIGS